MSDLPPGPPSTAAHSPNRFGHYRIDAPLGRGGMGEVFRATDTRLGRSVAIKIMHTDSLAGDEIATRRFLREARAASALNHPNIVTVHQIDATEDGDHYIVQELIEGRTLRDLAASPLPIDRVCEIGRQTAHALAAAHEAGIVHRDIKPENIMLREDGYVKVLDFGLARLTERTGDGGDSPTFETDVGSLTGTPAYMSPEQAGGDQVGSATDVWSLGVLLYELVAGDVPFTGRTPVNVIAAVLTASPPPLDRARPDVPRPLADAVDAMLEKEPDRRPTARDVEALLTTLLAGDEPAPRAAPRIGRRPTVGREEERARLAAAYGRASAGAGGIVAITGEPGIGKTSLLEDFLAELRVSADRPTIAEGRCSESLAGSEAYLPVLEALDELRSPATGPSFEAVMRSVAPTWYGQLTAEDTGTGGAAGEDGEAAPAASQERMKRELRALLDQVSKLKPLVLVIDDLHWADVSTVDILNYLAGHVDDARVLILTCYRPSDMALVDHPFLAIRSDLQARGVYQEVELDFLSRADVERYLELQFPGHDLPESFAADVHRRTEGSPLFMADLVRYLRDSGGIVEEAGGTWRLAPAADSETGDLPESVRGMIARKIDQIDDDQRRLLVAASVQGHEFDSATLAEALELDPVHVEDQLETLERVHVFVRQIDEYEFPDRTLTVRYHFVHVLYQNALFESLRPTRRVQMAGRIADSLASHQGDDAALAARLAVLYETAREFATSARYFFLAAQRAVSLFGYAEALALAERGLQGLEGLPETPERHQLELGLQMVRGHAQRSVHGWASRELEETFARARELCHRLNDPPELFPVQWNLTFFYMIKGDLEVVAQQIALLMEQAEASGRPEFQVAVHHVAGVSNEFLGELVESNKLLESARELHDADQHAHYNAMFGIDPGMIARAMSSRPLWSLGYPDQALERSRETVDLGRGQRQPATLVFALIVKQGIHLYRGEFQEAIALGDEIVDMCAEFEFAQEGEWGKCFQGAALAGAGRVDDGIARLSDALDALERLRSGLVRPTFLALLGDAHRKAGRVDDGLAAVTEGFAHAERTLEQGFVAELHRVHGELLLLDGERDAGEEAIRAGLAKARDQHARSFELRAATSLARLFQAEGRDHDARAELQPVYDWFTEGFETADLTAARSLLDALH
ncbi:MAG: protein kinase [Longimicrobiales bacterium]|nr:protein kinase [Longimicrobiales bacterium]